MKIVYFNYLFDRYGISIGSTRKAEQLMRAMADLGHDVRVYWMKRDGTVSYLETRRERGPLKRFLSRYLHDPKQFLRNFDYLIREWRIIREERPDVIISRLEPYVFSSLVWAKHFRIPLIIEVDAPWRYELRVFYPEFVQWSRFGRWIDVLNINQADHAFCVSHAMRSYFVRDGARPEKLSVITNAADLSRFHPGVPHRHILERYHLEGKVVIGFVGAFQRWHGVENLMRLIPPLVARYSQVCFLLVGQGGELKNELEGFVHERGLDSRVFFAGFVPIEEMPAYVVSMDIVLALYPKHPFFYFSPVKLFEYMACGRAIVATGIGQIAEIIQHGVNGLLCDPDRLEHVLDLMDRLIQDEAYRKRLGEHARKTALASYGWNHKAEALSEICLRVRSQFASS